jgi:hypothetical protein
MNPAQYLMLAQIITCLGGAIGFFIAGKPWGASTWFFYACANVGWFMIAKGAA